MYTLIKHCKWLFKIDTVNSDHGTQGGVAVSHVTEVVGGSVPQAPAGRLHALGPALTDDDVGDDLITG